MRAGIVLFIVSACTPPPPSEPPVDDPAPPLCTVDPGPTSGYATHYDATDPGKCSFPVGEKLVAAINHPDYGKAEYCGACLLVTGPASDVVVRVVDSCPACKPGDLDLSTAAFALLAPLDHGRIPISWRVVDCDVKGPLVYRFKDGSHSAWMAIQVRNHRYPIASLAARDPSGAYRTLLRTDYDYFVGVGLGAGPFAVRLTDTRGHVVDDAAIALGADTSREVERASASQLPRCP